MTIPDPTQLAERYFTHIRERNLPGMLALFADNARCVMPDGRSFEGEAAVRAWFTNLFATQTLSPKILGSVASQSGIAVEVENQLPDGSTRNTANFFYLDSSGRIEHLRVYRRG
jgi:ketosteroid isomerase-like protein